MKLLHKKLLITAALCAALALTGCNGDVPADATDTSGTETQTQPDTFADESGETTDESADTTGTEEGTQQTDDTTTSGEGTTEPAAAAQTETQPVTSGPVKSETTDATQKTTEPATVKATEPATEKPTQPTTEKPTEPATEAKKTVYKDGTYKGAAWGYESDIEVSVTIKDDVITDIKLVSHADDEIYMQDAVSVIKSALKAQSADVDTVSGATMSADGIKNAIAAALKKAKN